LFDVGVRGESVAEAKGGRERETVPEAERERERESVAEAERERERETVAEGERERERESVAEAESAFANGFQPPDADRCMMYVCVYIYSERERECVC
jgi:hypothetical protein